MSEVPAGFQAFPEPNNGFVNTNGPLFAKVAGEDLLLGFRVEARHCNPGGTCHGGMLMTFADMQLALGTNYKADLQRFLPTISLSCDFLAPAPLGAWVEGRTEIARTARTMVFAHGIVTADGRPAVRTNGIYQIRGEPSPQFAFRAIFG